MAGRCCVRRGSGRQRRGRDVRRGGPRVRLGVGHQAAGGAGGAGRGRGGRDQPRRSGRDRHRPRGHRSAPDGARQRARRGSARARGGARHPPDLLERGHRTPRVTLSRRGRHAVRRLLPRSCRRASRSGRDVHRGPAIARRDVHQRRPGPRTGRIARADRSAARVDVDRGHHGSVPGPARGTAGLRAADRERLGSGLRGQGGQEPALDRDRELCRARTATSASPEP